MIKLLKKQVLAISEIAAKLDQTEANASVQVKILEQASIVAAEYAPGQHGLKKVCSIEVDRFESNL
jgi:predicted transcriptional regulator